jgi:signal transduction histidine kinase
LRRSVILETLEKQVDIRTQHLATLYDINAVASEPLELQMILEQVLRILSESLGGQAGAIHFLNQDEELFQLGVQRGLPAEALELFQDLPARGGFWERLAGSTNPVVINDTASETDLPAAFTRLRQPVEWRHNAAADSSHVAPGLNQADQPTGLPMDLPSGLPAGLPAYIGAPVRANGEIIGLLSLFDTSILDYSIEDITLFMTVADQIGGLVERARLSKQAEIAAVIQERQRLARELHDSVTQLLYSQVLFAGAGLKVLKQGELVTTEQHLDRISQAALQALKEMRLLVYQLRPSDYLDEGLVGALTRRLDSVENRTGINARLLVEGTLSLDESLEVALYRIAEEALNNTLKHAQATSVVISLRAFDSRVILEVSDDGIGFDPQDPGNRPQREAGMGLQNMRERTAALGGQMEIQTRPGEGTTVKVEVEVQP